jgi:hypothetical protein
LHHGIKQAGVHGAFSLLQAPALGQLRQIKQGRQSPQRQMNRDEQNGQHRQCQVQGHIHTIRRPKHRHHAVVVARQQG